MMLSKDILISKYLSGNASEKEKQELEAWIAQSDVNRREFEASRKTWQIMRPAREEGTDVERSWSEFLELAEEKTTGRVISLAGRRNLLRAAAGLALVACLALLVRFYVSQDEMNYQQISAHNVSATPAQPDHYPDTFLLDAPQSLRYIEVLPHAASENKTSSSRRSEHRKVALITISAGDSAKLFMLPDNSIVLLNAGSTLTYPENFSLSQRRLSLDGEAFFEITHDTNQFVVACNETVIRSSNASFNLRSFARQEQVEVILVSGSAEFSGIGKREFKKLNLEAGEMGIYDHQTEAFSKSNKVRQDYKWWKKKGFREKLKRFFEKIRRTFNH